MKLTGHNSMNKFHIFLIVILWITAAAHVIFDHRSAPFNIGLATGFTVAIIYRSRY